MFTADHICRLFCSQLIVSAGCFAHSSRQKHNSNSVCWPFLSTLPLKWQPAIAWIDQPGDTLLISSYCMLSFSLTLVVSLPCCNIQDPEFFSTFYEEQNVQYSQILFPCNFSIFPLHSYHLLPIMRIFPVRRFASLNICFVEYRNQPFHLWLLASFTPFYFQ